MRRGLEGKKVGWQMGAGSIKSARTHRTSPAGRPAGPAGRRQRRGSLRLRPAGRCHAWASRRSGGSAVGCAEQRPERRAGAKAGAASSPLACPFSHLQRHLEKFLCLSLSNDVLVRGRRNEIIAEIIFISCLEICEAHLFSTEAITPPRG